MRVVTERWVESCAERLAVDLEMFAPEGARSPTVSTITLPEGLVSGAFTKAVAVRGFTIGGGYGEAGERALRLGHMGDQPLETLGNCLDACGDALGKLVT